MTGEIPLHISVVLTVPDVPSNVVFSVLLPLDQEERNLAKLHRRKEVRYWPEELIGHLLETERRNQLRTSHALYIVESNAPSEHSAPSNDA
jgi:hypothetical protein